MLSDDPIISKVLLRYKFWPKRAEFVPPKERVPLADELPDVPRETKHIKFTDAVRLVPHIYTIIKGLIVKDYKTTIAGVVKAAFFLLGIFGVSTGNINEALVGSVIYAIVDLVQAWFTADKKGASND